MLNKYFIKLIDIFSSHLVDIFSCILNSGHISDNGSDGTVIPIFKKNDPNEIHNCRGITLVSCFSKVFTGILNKRIIDWVVTNDVISDAQFGFRKERFTKFKSHYPTNLN